MNLTENSAVLPGDTLELTNDSTGLASDTLPPIYGVVIDAPIPVREAKEPDASTSWLFVGLILCFTVVAVRFKNNGRYLVSLWKDITEIRERRNVFDDTVRETSFLVLLNILWIVTGSVLFGCLLHHYPSVGTTDFPIIADFPAPPSRTLAMTTLLCAFPAIICYTFLMFFAYWMVGNVFSDSVMTKMWIRGYAATNGILSVCLLPVALLALCYPSRTEWMLITAAFFFILAKILFLYKGFRIFFSQGSSWVLFLYYLCSLEIVPLVLTYGGALISERLW